MIETSNAHGRPGAGGEGRFSHGDLAALAVAVGAFGVAFGTTAASAGLSVWQVAASSLLVYAGGSQFAFVGVLAAGGGPWLAALGGLLLNLRLIVFSATAAPLVAEGARGWPVRLLGTHLVTDEAVAAAIAGDPRTAGRTYWRVGVVVFLVWQVTTVAGVLLGGVVGDPRSYGLDLAFPAGFLALLWPSLKGPAAAAGRRAAAGGAVAALLGVPLLPAGVPIAAAAVAGAALSRGRREVAA